MPNRIQHIVMDPLYGQNANVIRHDNTSYAFMKRDLPQLDDSSVEYSTVEHQALEEDS